MIHLTERFGEREIYLIGTMNMSTMLARRTEKLIETVQPDEVYVQASKEYFLILFLFLIVGMTKLSY